MTWSKWRRQIFAIDEDSLTVSFRAASALIISLISLWRNGWPINSCGFPFSTDPDFWICLRNSSIKSESSVVPYAAIAINSAFISMLPFGSCK